MILPLALSGFVNGQDTAPHLLWSRHFAAQLWAGEAYPRWLQEMNAGYGSPAFFYYPPLPYYAAGLFPGCTDPWVPLGLACALGLALSGVTAYFWLRPIAGPASAFVAALFYMLMPYHLGVDVFVRFAFAEQWAFVSLPLILLAVRRIALGEVGGVPVAGVGQALLALSHLPTTVAFFPLPLAYAAFAAPAGSRLKAVGKTALAVGLGLALSAVYLLPALTTQSAVSTDVMWMGDMSYERNYLFDGETELRRQLDLIAVLAAALALAAYALGTGPEQGRERAFWLFAVFATFFMMLPWSRTVWEWIPPLQKIQFPWRLLSITTVAVTALLAHARLARGGVGRPATLRTRVATGGCALVGGLLLAVNAETLVRSATFVRAVAPSTMDRPEYRPRWAWAFEELARQEHPGAARARILGDGSVEVARWKPRSIELDYRSPADCWVEVGQFYYPGWTARIGGVALLVEPSEREGLVRIRAPGGQGRLHVALEPQPVEAWGRIVSGTALALLAVGALLPRLRRERKAAPR